MLYQLVLPFSDDGLYDGRREYLRIASPDRRVTAYGKCKRVTVLHLSF